MSKTCNLFGHCMVAHYSHKKITWNITTHQEILADFNSNPEKIKQNKIKMENY